MSISIVSKEKEDKCKELLEDLLTKYPESLEELLGFLINAEQFYRENKECETQLLSEVSIGDVEDWDYYLKDPPFKKSKIIIMKAKYIGRAKPLPYKEDDE